MDEAIAGIRLCLIGREKDLQHLLDVGIEDVDWYWNAHECFVLLNNIDENERTPDEVSQWKRLLELTEMTGIKSCTILMRLRRGWSSRKTLTTPVRKRNK